ncbi:hypothetical protein [Oxalobacter paraformigenes]|uniref:Uncharacterized protein n=1 Tax=Oxalobacter paraformigenes TaxID=556268 RepID=C3X3V4_9BURK|nr:hypothetical protein [Oxalobacter paraformigenes]EEO27890.2 hypothetical protein OFAG_01043 [Oxalobacter paraformigenes]
MHALIDKTGRVIETAAVPFDVHPDFRWIEAPGHVQTGHVYADGRFTAPAVSLPLAEKPAMTGQEAAAVSATPASSFSETPVTATAEPETKAGPEREIQAEPFQRLEIHIHLHR